MNPDIISLLAEGDKKTVVGVDSAVNMALRQPALLADLVQAISKENEALNMRIADTLQKVYVQKPDVLRPYKDHLFGVFEKYDQKEIQWHMAQILPSLGLSPDQLNLAIKKWDENFHFSKSSIVRTFSLQAVFDTAATHPQYASIRNRLLGEALEGGSPAMKTRARMLLTRLDAGL